MEGMWEGLHWRFGLDCVRVEIWIGDHLLRGDETPAGWVCQEVPKRMRASLSKLLDGDVSTCHPTVIFRKAINHG